MDGPQNVFELPTETPRELPEQRHFIETAAQKLTTDGYFRGTFIVLFT